MCRTLRKCTLCYVCLAKNQFSLHIHAFWSIFGVHLKKPWTLGYLKKAQRRLWSDCVDAQSDLSLRRAHISEATFSRGVNQYLFNTTVSHNNCNIHICRNLGLNGPQYAKMCLQAYADSEGPDQPKHPRHLIRNFIVRKQNHWTL